LLGGIHFFENDQFCLPTLEQLIAINLWDCQPYTEQQSIITPVVDNITATINVNLEQQCTLQRLGATVKLNELVAYIIDYSTRQWGVGKVIEMESTTIILKPYGQNTQKEWSYAVTNASIRIPRNQIILAPVLLTKKSLVHKYNIDKINKYFQI
jgi:hypothetical protein